MLGGIRFPCHGALVRVWSRGYTGFWSRACHSLCAVAELGGIPPGNAPGEGKWTRRARTAKPEIKLTPGKGAADLSVPLEQILDAVVAQNRVRAPARPPGCPRPHMRRHSPPAWPGIR